MQNNDLINVIHEDLTPDQVRAVDHIGSHARILAGPGTGKTKTLTRHVLSLILQHNVESKAILAITFTRLAAAQLRKEIKAILKPTGKDLPQISTLHSFALRQILHNAQRVDVLPQPIRIADDWEERNIIQEDLKRLLKAAKIKDVQKLVNQLSADWETLRVEEAGWKDQFPNAAFLGAWDQHRMIYGETLRAELVYQLKRSLNQNREFILDGSYKHVLIDEYQDLNACDLAVVRGLAESAELFVVGDDDQSIYGFRFANPVGIRQFATTYPNVEKLSLEICFRCDRDILKIAEFVAALDPERLPKPTKPLDAAGEGQVVLLNFRDQEQEADFIALEIKKLVDTGTPKDKIAVLLRSDRHGMLSRPITERLNSFGVPTSLVSDNDISDDKLYRIVLSFLRLASNANDGLALRTLLMCITTNNVGEECFSAIWKYAAEKGQAFSETIREIQHEPAKLPKFGDRISKAVQIIDIELAKYKTIEDLEELITAIIADHSTVAEEKDKLIDHFRGLLAEQETKTLAELMTTINAALENSDDEESLEQETSEDAISVLTMHQAKGLTFDVCFIAAAEDEYLPGRNSGAREADERRLLYVSMTRARHQLFITYCNRRTGQQAHSGSNSGNPRRTLTRFLKNSPLKVVFVQATDTVKK